MCHANCERESFRIKEALLWEFIYGLRHKKDNLPEENRSSYLRSSEKALLAAIVNVKEDYRRNRLYFASEAQYDEVLSQNTQLVARLLEVTEERDTLKSKIKEAQIASGLFIQSVRTKLGLGEDK